MYSSVSTHMQQQLVCAHIFIINIEQNVFRNALSHLPMRLQKLFLFPLRLLGCEAGYKDGQTLRLHFFFWRTLAADMADRLQKLFAIATHLLLTTLLLYSFTTRCFTNYEVLAHALHMPCACKPCCKCYNFYLLLHCFTTFSLLGAGRRVPHAD